MTDIRRGNFIKSIPIMAGIFALIMLLLIKWYLSINLSVLDYIIVIFYAFLISAAVGISLYFNLKVASTVLIFGSILSLISMVYVFNQQVDFKGVVGMVTSAQVMFISLLVGANLQMIAYLIKKRKK